MRKVPLLSGGAGSLIAEYVYGETGQSSQEGNSWTAQTFLVNSVASAKFVKVKVYRIGSPGTVRLSLRAVTAGKPSGADLGFVDVNGDGFSAVPPGYFEKFTFGTPIALSAATVYAIVLRATGGDGANKSMWKSDDGAPLYTGGSNCFSINGGVDWTINTGTDMMFQVSS